MRQSSGEMFLQPRGTHTPEFDSEMQSDAEISQPLNCLPAPKVQPCVSTKQPKQVFSIPLLLLKKPFLLNIFDEETPLKRVSGPSH